MPHGVGRDRHRHALGELLDLEPKEPAALALRSGEIADLLQPTVGRIEHVARTALHVGSFDSSGEQRAPLVEAGLLALRFERACDQRQRLRHLSDDAEGVKRDNRAVAGFDDLRGLPLRRIWDGINARLVNGERLSLGVVELDPGAVVQEHSHEHEQLGMVIRGAMTLRIGDETRAVGPGETWTIPPNRPHEATAGPEGAIVVDVFAPVREDWVALEPAEVREPRWP